VQQRGTLRDYLKEFERLANQVVGRPQKALIGNFLGGLRADISTDVRKFKPWTLRENVEFVRMREDELQRTKMTPSPVDPMKSTLQSNDSPTQVKKLSWEEMRRR
jgi:hypothetical protein